MTVAPEDVIPLTSILSGAIGTVIVALAAMFWTYKKRVLLSREIRLALEQGQEIDDLLELFRPRLLLRGLVWFMIGLGGFIAISAMDGIREGLIGLVPMGIGLAHVIYCLLERTRR